ncbi:MAG: DUF1223 domain-containing protein, partial [Casimicrobium sp.]
MIRNFRRNTVIAAAGALVAAYAPTYAVAQSAACKAMSGKTVPALIELYPSEGCNSCPPADRWLSQQIANPETNAKMIALAFHVDYWDYIGWKDSYARVDYGVRHSSMVRANGSSTVYTPQVFINGRDDRSWRVGLAGMTPTAARATIDVEADWKDGKLAFRGRVIEGGDAVRIRYAVTENGISTAVKAGENAGETLKQDAVVRDHAIVNVGADKSFSINAKLASNVKREKSLLHV